MIFILFELHVSLNFHKNRIQKVETSGSKGVLWGLGKGIDRVNTNCIFQNFQFYLTQLKSKCFCRNTCEQCIYKWV